MASIKCACGADIPMGRMACPQCRRPRPRRMLATESRVADPEADEQPSEEETPCDHRASPPGSIICVSCGSPTSVEDGPVESNGVSKRGFAVKTPWGMYELEMGITEIGREVGPFTDYLQAYLTVSRRHASLRLMTANGRRRRLFVTDHDSTNRTYVNGQPLDPNEPTELNYGDVVALSTKVALKVEEMEK